ncbi:hypothetical protein BT93_B0526 [Corymbia citriodora subsp. variegata]|nr:hypothetical protein BT93_B0526 [Corymbia citriodora subsp. variegata]
MREYIPAARHSIFRVHHHLRKVNEKAYDPEILAIGRYQNGNDKFKFMEEQKLRYLQQLLERRNKGSINRYMLAFRDWNSETINSNQENFLAMMLIDGCFIIELFRKCSNEKLSDKDDPIMHGCGIRTSIRRDLLLLENQLPLFVLSNLYDLTKGPDEHHEFSDFAVGYFDSELGGTSRNWTIGESQGEHLLHLYYTWCTSDLPEKHCLGCKTVMPSATELRESGIGFRAVLRGKLSNIKFENGTLEIPVLLVEDITETQFRNLIAYKQYCRSRGINYFTDYVTFLDCLINRSKDVEVLRRAGIIKNYFGNDEAVVQIFNKFGDYVTVSNSYYSKIFTKVNAYCNIPTVVLRREYFHNPWAFLPIPTAISFLLTVAQTVFSILSYTKQS